ncbi:hypothetical protein AHAS_Ahas02G0111300 [Arachis hypogaea]
MIQVSILIMVGNITRKTQILSTPIHGDLLQNPKMSKRIMRDTNHHHKMIHIIILMVDGSITKKLQILSSQIT